MNSEQNLILKTKLEIVINKINKILENHNELKYILADCVLFDEHILEEDLFFIVEKEICEIQLEINSFIN